MSAKIHKLKYIPYTGWYHICTGSDKFKLQTSHDWKKVTCKHCIKLKDKEYYE